MCSAIYDLKISLTFNLSSTMTWDMLLSGSDQIRGSGKPAHKSLEEYQHRSEEMSIGEVSSGLTDFL